MRVLAGTSSGVAPIFVESNGQNRIIVVKGANDKLLPADVDEGDYVEIGMLGAYGVAMASRFNGFGETETVAVGDAPMASLYGLAPRSLEIPQARTAEIVKLPRAKGRRRRRK